MTAHIQNLEERFNKFRDSQKNGEDIILDSDVLQMLMDVEGHKPPKLEAFHLAFIRNSNSSGTASRPSLSSNGFSPQNSDCMISSGVSTNERYRGSNLTQNGGRKTDERGSNNSYFSQPSQHTDHTYMAAPIYRQFSNGANGYGQDLISNNGKMRRIPENGCYSTQSQCD